MKRDFVDMHRWDVITILLREYKVSSTHCGCSVGSHLEAIHGVEVGVLYGENATHLLQQNDDLQLLLVDPYLHYSEPKMTAETLLTAKQTMLQNMAKFQSRARWLEMDSIAAAQTQLNGIFDFVFIDANHEEEFVRQDVAVWRPKIKPGGYLMGHDASWPGVAPVVKDLGAELYKDDVWAVRV